MMDRVRGLIAPLAAVCLVGFSAQQAKGQSTVITGRVTDTHGAPIPGANVSVRTLGVGATANETGRYTITIPDASVKSQQVVLNARFIGYAPQDLPMTLIPGPHTADFSLRPDPFQLNAVVVTGVADSTSAKNLTFSVAKVTAAQVEDVPAPNAIVALAGKVAGAKIEMGVGNPGGTPAIRLRGSTSLQVGESTPLIVVDGVITREGISDLDAQNIESIEVLKGAAGASFYGSDAANGVINITTKRGRTLAENHVAITARSEYGQSGIAHWPSVNHGTRDQFNADGTVQVKSDGSAVKNTSGFDDTPFPSSGPNHFRNQMQEWMQNNTYYNNDVTLGLRRGNTNFNSSFSSDHNGGILPFKKGQFRQNVRLNVDQGVGDKADFSASITYGNQNNDYDPENDQAWFALYQAPPFIDLAHPDPAANDSVLYYPVLPTYTGDNSRGNPLYDLYTNTFDLNRQRFLGSVSGRYRPTDWLRLEANYGTDRLAQRQRTYTARGTLSSTSGGPTQGGLRDYSDNNVSWNSQLRATATKLVIPSLLSTTSLAYQLENVSKSSFNAGGGQLNVNAVPDLAAVDQSFLTVGSYLDQERTTDYMASQSLTFKDRYIVDGLYRRDGSSLFGPDNRWSDFYRISGAYRLTQDFNIPGVQELKLHAARGTAGLRPKYWYQYESYDVSNGHISKSTLGNKELKPAILTENEYGINADFLDRFSGELTYADRVTKGAFLQVPLSKAINYGFGSQWQNAADIGSKTLEGALQVRVLDRRNVTYDVSFTGDHTTQTILSMNRAPFRVSAGGQGQNVFWYQPGQPLGIIYGQKYVHTFAQLLDNPKNAGAVASDYVVNPLGFLVLKSKRGTSGERPIQYVDKNGNVNFKIGDVNPKLNYGIANDVKVGPFNVHALFDGQYGGDIYNFSKQWQFQDLRSGDMDMTNKAQDQKIAEGFFSTGLYNGLNASEYFVESGTYLKLRELSVGYDVNPRYLSKVGLGRASGVRLSVLGRNLITWTNYTGFDPDVTSGSDFNYRIDGFRYPPFRTITGQVEVRF
ncbi:MAG TPA: SusC/RagA family TonB-linked outer membrane protein [Gemmatimonadaceae bacterium]|nr:SusC/RagA family TonB-linked outer membrane protein [Gemmatimonadaceae bacterium]